MTMMLSARNSGWKRMCILAVLVMLAIILPAAQADTIYYMGSVSTREEMVEYIAEEAAAQPEEIRFEFTENLYEIIDDSEAMTEVVNEAGILGCSWSYNSFMCTLTDISALPPHVMCETEEDVYQALYCAMTGNVNIRMTPELYALLSADDFIGLYRIEGRAGIYSRNMTYYDSSRLIEYTNLQFVQNFNSVKSLDELKTVIESRTGALAGNFGFHCPPEVYEQLRADDFIWLNDLESNCGILWRNMRYFNEKNMITYSDVVYYPGKRVVTAVNNGWMDMLNADERALFEVADRIVKEAKASCTNDLQLEIALHDAIVDRTVYELNELEGQYTYQDTAIGALIEGKADCDGFADAFYLLGSLAGFDVRLQNGISLEQDSDLGHMWNAIKINGQWYFVDVTWDNSEEGRFYSYMNIGEDIASMVFDWHRTAAIVPVAQSTDPYNYYYVINGVFFDSSAGVTNCINNALAAGQSELLLMARNLEYPDNEAFLEKAFDGVRYACNISPAYTGNMIALAVHAG